MLNIQWHKVSSIVNKKFIYNIDTVESNFCLKIYLHLNLDDMGLGTPILCTAKNSGTPLQLTLCVCGVNEPWIVQYCSMYLMKKKIHALSGPSQFKPVLFKGQPYIHRKKNP